MQKIHYTELRGETRASQEREEKRAATRNEMLEELESRQREIEEPRQENEHLEYEIPGMMSLLEEALRKKGTARKGPFCITTSEQLQASDSEQTG